MSVCAIVLARDEEDIIETTVNWLLLQVDHVVLLDHGSVDDTAKIARELGCEVREALGPGYRQAERMNAAATQALADGFEWIVPVDADEIWVPCFEGTISEVLADCSAPVVQGIVHDHHPTSLDSGEEDAILRQPWRQQDIRWLKMAARTNPGLQFTNGYHATLIDGQEVFGETLFTIHHFPYRSIERLIRNVRNAAISYAADPTMPETDSRHKRSLAQLSDRDIESWWSKHAFLSDPEAAGLIFDPVANIVPIEGESHGE
jgi:glycosyltransferase involved in cell wall biosynthesis